MLRGKGASSRFPINRFFSCFEFSDPLKSYTAGIAHCRVVPLSWLQERGTLFRTKQRIFSFIEHYFLTSGPTAFLLLCNWPIAAGRKHEDLTILFAGDG